MSGDEESAERGRGHEESAMTGRGHGSGSFPPAADDPSSLPLCVNTYNVSSSDLLLVANNRSQKCDHTLSHLPALILCAPAHSRFSRAWCVHLLPVRMQQLTVTHLQSLSIHLSL